MEEILNRLSNNKKYKTPTNMQLPIALGKFIKAGESKSFQCGRFYAFINFRLVVINEKIEQGNVISLSKVTIENPDDHDDITDSTTIFDTVINTCFYFRPAVAVYNSPDLDSLNLFTKWQSKIIKSPMIGMQKPCFFLMKKPSPFESVDKKNR